MIKRIQFRINCVLRIFILLLFDRKYRTIRKKAIKHDIGVKKNIRELDSIFVDLRDNRYGFFEGLVNDQVIERKIHWKTCGKNDVVFICVVKNDIQRVRLQVKHMQKLGITHLVYVDNGSKDGTIEWLEKQDNVNLYTVESRFHAEKKNAWIRQITNIYGYNRWYLICDSDELFEYPNCENTSISEFSCWLEQLGKTNVCSMMMDMYTCGKIVSLEEKSDEEILSDYCWFDTDTYKAVSVKKGLKIVGGPRKRMFYSYSDNMEGLLTKYPLIKLQMNDIYKAHFPILKNGSLDRQLHSVIKHYKFLPFDLIKYRKIIQEGTYFGGSIEYRKCVEAIDENPNISFFNDQSEKYTCSYDMKKISIFDSEIYEHMRNEDYRCFQEESV